MALCHHTRRLFLFLLLTSLVPCCRSAPRPVHPSRGSPSSAWARGSWSAPTRCAADRDEGRGRRRRRSAHRAPTLILSPSRQDAKDAQAQRLLKSGGGQEKGGGHASAAAAAAAAASVALASATAALRVPLKAPRAPPAAEAADISAATADGAPAVASVLLLRRKSTAGRLEEKRGAAAAAASAGGGVVGGAEAEALPRDAQTLMLLQRVHSGASGGGSSPVFGQRRRASFSAAGGSVPAPVPAATMRGIDDLIQSRLPDGVAPSPGSGGEAAAAPFLANFHRRASVREAVSDGLALYRNVADPPPSASLNTMRLARVVSMGPAADVVAKLGPGQAHAALRGALERRRSSDVMGVPVGGEAGGSRSRGSGSPATQAAGGGGARSVSAGPGGASRASPVSWPVRGGSGTPPKAEGGGGGRGVGPSPPMLDNGGAAAAAASSAVSPPAPSTLVSKESRDAMPAWKERLVSFNVRGGRQGPGDARGEERRVSFHSLSPPFRSGARRRRPPRLPQIGRPSASWAPASS